MKCLIAVLFLGLGLLLGRLVAIIKRVDGGWTPDIPGCLEED